LVPVEEDHAARPRWARAVVPRARQQAPSPGADDQQPGDLLEGGPVGLADGRGGGGDGTTECSDPVLAPAASQARDRRNRRRAAVLAPTPRGARSPEPRPRPDQSPPSAVRIGP
jgi:hypothetical protein